MKKKPSTLLYRLLCPAFTLMLAGALTTNTIQAQVITTVAGNGSSAFGGDGGAATSAGIYQPVGLAIDGAGNYYIADGTHHRVRKVDASGVMTTVAGNGVAGYSGDGTAATAAQLNNPTSIAFDGAGNMYIGDLMNHRIRKVNTSGIISTYAGTGITGHSGDGGPATAARFDHPFGVLCDLAGNLVVSDEYNQCIRKISTAGIITNFAGLGTIGFSGDGGPASAATFYMPHYMCMDNLGNLYVTDNSNHRIRKINTAGIVQTVTGTGVTGYAGDGGPATAATINWCSGLRTDASGSLYIADQLNNRVRVINAAGIINTLAGNGSATYSGDGGPAIAAGIDGPSDIQFDAAGNLLIADLDDNHIRKISIGAPVNHIPYFTAGSSISITKCPLESAFNIDSILAVSDGDIGQTLTWSVLTLPAHGLMGAAYTAPSTGGVVVPSTCYYSPTPGYFGTDVFQVRVSDGFAYDTITINVTLLDLPAAGAISGVSTVCVGSTVALAETVTGGAWSLKNTGLCAIGSTGIVTGVAPGIDTIVYTTTNACGTATAIFPIIVLDVSQCTSGIADAAAPNGFTVSPNPSSGTFTIKMATRAAGSMRIAILNALGQRIREYMINTGAGDEVATDLPSGVYMMEIVTGDQRIRQRIIIAK